jgi:tryptophan-rich sensory protein
LIHFYKRDRMMIDWKAVGATLLPFAGSIPGGYLTKSNIKNIKGWYEHLKKPEWRPPNWVCHIYTLVEGCGAVPFRRGSGSY